ncbi:non-ribosomal peptide synthetase [Cyanosarcina cf. burmensis CCALA 770]|nr:non-ribosomal peptide synthetase [Cyanosarcina cf. burmensis CCALA 770]
MFTKKDFEPSVSLQSSLAYWKQQLAGVSPLLSLPTDRSRRTDRAYRGSSQSFVLSRKLTIGLSSLSRQEGVTLFTTLLAAFDTLLYRYTSTEDIVVGSPVVNQNYSSIDLTFLNALVLRTDLSGNPSFQQLLERVREVILSAQNHQNVPLSILITELQLEVDPSYSPLFQVTFTFNESVFLQDIELSSLATSPWGIEDNKAKVDLALLIEQNSNGLRGRWLYNASLFDSSTIERMNEHFQTLLASIVANPRQPISELSILTTQEQQQLLVELNHTRRDYPRDKCIHQLFEQQVVQNPERVAVVFEGQQLTYGELNTKANQLARYLNSLGVSSNVVVGICLERSLEMVVGFLGILKAGGAYVPLDPSYPSARLAFMLEDSQPLAILTQKRLLEVLPDRGAKVICLDTNWQEICQQKPENPVVEINSEHLAYIMYTSGSTGKPKGVMITHQGLVNHNLAIAELFELTASDRVLQSASISFDISVEEIFPTWISGASLILRNEEVLTSTRNLLEFIKREQITILDLPTALWHEIVHGMCEFGEKVPDCVRLVVVGGEKASAVAYLHWWNLVGDRCRWINTYGPTETTVSATFYEPAANLETQQFISEIPIGRPLANTQIYILDQQLQLVPIGVPGELYIGGAGVARGYFNRPELTAAKFIPNPFTNNTEDRLYKTGDLVRYLPNGNIEFLGRSDYQVKVRGFRIELAEIEALLSQHPSVQDNVVIAREDEPGNKHLLAYILPKSKQKLNTSELREFLRRQLPDYMMPSSFTILETIPLTPNGKIDRRALPAPTYGRQESENTFVAPRNQLEIQITKIWEKVLGIQPIGVKHNFFELGGNSLIAVRLFAEIEKTWSRNLPLATLFEVPTVEKLACLLQQEESSVTWSSLVPIQPNGSKLPLFCIHPIGGNVLEYHSLANYLDREQPIYGLQAQGLDGKQEPLRRVEDMANHYINEIRSFQPNGPYLLAGYSFGGLVAFDMARKLHDQGEKVALLVLLDTSSPNLAESNRSLVKFIRVHLSNLWQLKPKDRLRYIKNWLQWKLNKGNYKGFISSQLFETLKHGKVIDCNFQAAQEYVPQVYSKQGTVTLFRSKIQPVQFADRSELGWGELVAGDLEIEHIPGEHHSLLKEPAIQVVAEKFKIRLEQVQAKYL